MFGFSAKTVLCDRNKLVLTKLQRTSFRTQEMMLQGIEGFILQEKNTKTTDF